MRYNSEKKCTIWQVSGENNIPKIIAVQENSVQPGKYQLCFSKDKNCSLKKIIFTLNEDKALAARILVKVLLRLGITPEAAMDTGKNFYQMTKENPDGNQFKNLSSKA